MNEKLASIPSTELDIVPLILPPILLPPALPKLVLLLRPLLSIPGLFKLRLDELVLFVRSNFNERGNTDIINLSWDIVNVAGSNLPLAVTLNTLIPRWNDSGTDMCSSADLKLERGGD